MKRPFMRVGALAIAVLTVGVLSNNVFAQSPESIALSLSPPSFDLSANPGEVLDNQFKIVNNTDKDLTLSVTPKNFTAKGEEGAIELTEETTNFSVASWITTTPSEVVLPARGSQLFDFTISVPVDAEPGSHFGSIIVATDSEQIDASGARVSQEIGPLLLVKVAGDIVEDASIAEFKAAKAFWEKGPIALETRVENLGNVHFKPRGKITIKDMFGKEVTTINLTEENVLPDSIRKLTTEWSPGFVVGRYTADLSMVYGADDTIQTASTSFIVFPYKVIVPVVLGGIIGLFVLVRYRKRFSEAARVLSGKG